MTDTLENECREWLIKQPRHGYGGHNEVITHNAYVDEKSLASFVREQVLKERQRCVDVVVESHDDYRSGAMTKYDAYIHFATLLGLTEGKDER